MRKIILLLTLGLALTLSKLSFADEEPKTKTLQGVEVLTGFGWGKLQGKDNYNLVPISVAFNFDLKPITQKMKLNLKQSFQFQIEPFFGIVTQPESNIETGTSLWLKMGLVPDSWRLQPYAKIGAGIAYMTQHTNEQGTQFNFIEHVGAGLEYSLTKNTSLIIEGRWRHLSNASIKDPNHGINSYFALTGVSYKF